MPTDPKHVAFAVVSVVLVVGSAVLAGNFLALAAPFSGGAYGTVGGNQDALPNQFSTTTVESPYGEATVRYDEWGVPHVTAENERAAYYAVGYVHARDRLFQMDLVRRSMRGQLAEAFGPRAVESDRFHRQMGFTEAANASWEAMADTEYGDSVRAYTDGVNRYMDRGDLPVEFRLNDYRPDPWTPTDTLLVGKQISWGLSGDFRDLKMAAMRSRLPAATSLYPDRLAHDSPIVRPGTAQPGQGGPGQGALAGVQGDGTAAGSEARARLSDPGALYRSLSRYEREVGIGSNSWVVSGNYTDTGRPMLANDPHLSLMVPPVWYEQHVRVTGEDGYDVRGVTFPGIPSVVIGQNTDVAWGFTNVGADQTDLYTYDWVDNRTYRYRGGTREVSTHTETIRVSGGEDVEVTVEQTVHGPLVERSAGHGNTTRVAVAWVGLTATREALALHGFNNASGMAEFREYARAMDSPTQNLVAMSDDGGTYFRITGRYPVRRVDGEVVQGDRVFDGSAAEGEWQGFTPYGESSWEGFVPVDENVEVRDPGYLATANQRTMDDPPYYIATSVRYADPYRGARIYELLDRRAQSGDPITREYMREVQQDVRSKAAEQLAPQLLDARDAMDADARERAAALEGWEYEMTRDSEAALLFALAREEFVNETLYDEYHAAGLDESYYPHLWTVARLPNDSPWFDDVRTPERETKADVLAAAFEDAVARADRNGWETYGDYNRLDLDHPFPVAFVDYDERPMDASVYTVNNFRYAEGGQAGSSWRMLAYPQQDGPSLGVIPGGQSGDPFSPHYQDQLDEWATGEYKEMTFEVEGRVVIEFVGGGDGE